VTSELTDSLTSQTCETVSSRYSLKNWNWGM